MKKAIFVVAIISIQLMAYSCTPENLIEATQSPVACCGEDGEMTPPPPPPPPPTELGG